MSPYGIFFIIRPDKVRESFEIPTASISVGSDPQNALTLAHPDVAPVHARVECRQGSAVITDVSGSGGVFVNQTRVGEQQLRQGDVVKIGPYFLVYHPPGAASTGPVAAGSGAYAAPVGAGPAGGASMPPAGGSGGFAAPSASGAGPRPEGNVPPAAQPSASASGATPPAGGGRPLSPAPTHLPSVVAGQVNQQRLQPDQVVRIGRDPANTIVVPSLQASRFHAELLSRGGAFAIRDLGSTNGTFVNGQRIAPQTPVQLVRGAVIKISEHTFFFDGQQLEHYSEAGNARLDAIGLRRVVAGGQLLLRDISLSIQPREFVAVVGGSGAGKSTLVNALSGFRPADQGTVLLNGLDYYANIEAFRTALGYVPQDDIIHPELTAHRALHYAALLRMPDDVDPHERDGRIEEVLRDLHLSERRDVPVSSLSGGQRKRVSIGVELLTRPRLFFLDEPTSGLDPGMELEAMKIFRHLADQGHTLIVITHATTNIMLCDRIAFLARGGYLAYFGPPKEALAYFGARDFPEIYLKLEREKTPEQWGDEFRRSQLHGQYVQSRLNEVQALASQAAANPRASLPASASAPTRQGSGVRQLQILMQRYLDIITRDRTNLGVLFAQAPVLALVLLVVVWGKDNLFIARSAKELGTAQKFIFLLALFSLMCGTLNSVREIVKELPIYKRERSVNLRIFPYLMSKFLVLSAVSALQSLAFTFIVFSYLQKPDVDGFMGQMFMVLWMTNLGGVALGLAVSSVVPNQNLAMTLLPVVLLPQVVLAGILVPLEGDVSKLFPYLTILKWCGGMVGHLLSVHTWPSLMLVSPTRQIMQAPAPSAEVWDISLLPSDAGIGGIVGLGLYAAVCLGFATQMLKRRDKSKD